MTAMRANASKLIGFIMRNLLLIVFSVSCLIAAAEIAAASHYIVKPSNIISYDCKGGQCKEVK